MEKKKISWREYSEIELLNMLKQEIKRIGIEDYPSRTKYQELYNPDNTPSPMSYLNKFGKTWKELMEFIGLEYNKTPMAKERGALGKGVPRKKYETKWTKMSDEDMLDVISSEFRRLALTSKQGYADKRNPEIAPSTNTIMNRFGSWRNMKERLKERENGNK